MVQGDAVLIPAAVIDSEIFVAIGRRDHRELDATTVEVLAVAALLIVAVATLVFHWVVVRQNPCSPLSVLRIFAVDLPTAVVHYYLVVPVADQMIAVQIVSDLIVVGHLETRCHAVADRHFETDLAVAVV